MSPAVAALRATLGDALGYVIKTSGMSQREAAEACAVHQTNISIAIRGKTCSVEKQIDLLEALGYQVEIKVVKKNEG